MNGKIVMRRSLRGTRNGLNAAGVFLTRKRSAGAVYLVSFFLPFFLLAAIWAANGLFNGKMILAHDQYHQYYPFFLTLRDKLQNGGSLFYSWTSGMGINYLSLYAYYLSGPLNLVAALLPDSLVLAWFTLAVMIRISCAGLFCVVFLKKIFGKCDFVLPFFGLLYAFCAFIAGYYWNSIWLGTVALLPLVALGTVKLLRSRQPALYVTMLALSVFCSYYIGLFVCIFVLLLFICFSICYWDGFSGFLKRLGLIAVCTVIALGLTAVLTVPAYFGLKTTFSSVNRFPEGFKINISGRQNWLGVIDALRQIAANLALFTEPTTMTGLPNVFCGVITVVLSLAYFTRPEIKLREKLCCGLLLAFFAAGFVSRQLEYILHGFHFPNMLPHRFSFLFSFVLIFMAYRSYLLLDTLNGKSVLICACLASLFLVCAVSNNSAVSSILTAAVLVLAIGLLFLRSRQYLRTEALCVFLCFLFLTESCACMTLGVKKNGFTDGSDYPKSWADVQAALAAAEKREKDNAGLYRTEMTVNQTSNDNALYGYNGVSLFSSSASNGLSSFMNKIGLSGAPEANRYLYRETNPFVNMLLGLKYLVDRNGKVFDSDWFTEVYRSGNVRLLENEAWLPMGILLADEALNIEFAENVDRDYIPDVIANQNLLFRAVSGKEENLLTGIPCEKAESENGTRLKQTAADTYIVPANGTCNLFFTLREDCRFCIYLLSSQTGKVSVSVLHSGSETYAELDSYSVKFGCMRYFGGLSAGDVIKVCTSASDKSSEGMIFARAAAFDADGFNSLYSDLAQRTMETTAFDDTHVEGTVVSQRDSVLLTSIPYDAGWRAEVDGKETGTDEAWGAFLAVHLSGGKHTVRFTYEPVGFQAGLAVSLSCLLLFLLVLAFPPVRKRFASKRGKENAAPSAGGILPETEPIGETE